jgi:hypothetical protein
MDWVALFSKIDDSKIYMRDDLYGKYYCKNPKCHRMLLKYEDEFFPIPKIKSDFVVLSSMNIFLATEKFISVLKI